MKLNKIMNLISEECGAIINLHPLHAVFNDNKLFELSPDQYIHHGAMCRYSKLKRDFSLCLKHKSSIIKDIKDNTPFETICPYGLWDLVKPIFFQSRLVAILYLGYFLPQAPSPQDLNIQMPKIIDKETKEKLYHYAQFIEQFIQLELQNWSKNGGYKRSNHKESFYIQSMYRFIDNNFHKNIALSDFSDIMRCTPNYIGELIQKSTQKTFRQILTEKRMQEATVFLKLHGNLSISEISQRCGFSDSNYFSTVFRKIYGVSPKNFR